MTQRDYVKAKKKKKETIKYIENLIFLKGVIIKIC